ncbi:MAG: A/G-specific adenine glycosylase [Desulfovibrio sp.]|nr:A/G-specific adenine glycosylase [Desulfovibrio sp.]
MAHSSAPPSQSAQAQQRLPGLPASTSNAFFPPDAHLAQVQAALLSWFTTHQRPLPWRKSYTPYEVWISEVMLQQTQMERGVAYFQRWMERFPDIATLAAADEETVLRLWEGLGYYSRARHVLAAARRIRDVHGGCFPSKLADIRALPGVGPYTAGAIASIAFGERLPCVDANVERVVARLFNVDGPVKQEPTAGLIHAWALRLVPPRHTREHNQAMMEMGALVCRKKPRCPECPLARFCISRHLGLELQRPVPGKKARITPVSAVCGVLLSAGRVFVQKRLENDVWGNLWEFPGGSVEEGESPEQAIVREFLEETGLGVRVVAKHGLIRHGYTSYRLRLHCFGLALAAGANDLQSPPTPPVLTAAQAFRWMLPQELPSVAMPTPHRKLANRLWQGKGAHCL